MAFATGKYAYLVNQLNPGDTTITVDRSLGISSWRLYIVNDFQVEWLNFTTSTLSGSYYILGWLTRDIDQVAIPSVSNSTGKTWWANSKVTIVAMHDQLFDSANGGNISGNVIYNWAVNFTKTLRIPTYTDAAARDLAIPSPTVWMECFLTTPNNYYDYKVWWWALRALTTVSWLRTWLTPNTLLIVDWAWNEQTVVSTPDQRVVVSPYETWIVQWDTVGLIDWLYKCWTETASSINISWSSVALLSQTPIDSTRIMFLYDLSNSINAVIGTLTGDIISYWTPFVVYSATWVRWQIVKIWTDKVACAYGDTGSGSLQRVRILTISGTTITGWTEVTQSLNNGYVWNFTLSNINIVKLRSDAFVTLFLNNGSRTQIKSWTVSWTTITWGTEYANTVITWSWIWWLTSFSMAYLSDNYFVYDTYATWQWVWAQWVHILYINPSWTNVISDYNWNPASNYGWAYLSRCNDTTVVFNFSVSWAYTNTFSYLFWVNTPATAIADVWWYFPTIPIVTEVFWVLTWTSILIYQRATLMATILIQSFPYSNINSYMSGRLVYPTWANWTTRIVKLANTFYFWIAKDSVWTVSIKGQVTSSGVTPWILHYLQSNGAIWTTKTNQYIWRGLTTTSIILGY